MKMKIPSSSPLSMINWNAGFVSDSKEWEGTYI